MRKYCRILVAIFVCFAPLRAHAEKRVALIIGNSNYEHAPKLITPASDTAEIALQLKNAGFVVTNAQDLGLLEMKRLVRQFAAQTADSEIALVYYSGHGMAVDGTNYLVPVDAILHSERDIQDETLSVDRLLQALEPAKRLKLIILDVCQDNPFIKTLVPTSGKRATVARGLARVEPTEPNTLIAFSAEAGTVAADGAGTNSPFATALLKNLLTPGLDVRIAFGRIRDEVLADTAGRQEPFVYGSLGGGVITLVPVATPPPGQSADASAAGDYELVARIGTEKAWDMFIAAHPSGFYADLAKTQRTKLAAAARPASANGGRSDPVDVADAGKIMALQPVYFATNRALKQEPSLQQSSITSRRSMNLKYGMTIVSVPRRHLLGQVERPRFRYLTWQYEPERDEDHFRIKSMTSLARAEFVDRLRSDANSVLIFVHGYNVTFQDAVFKAAQIAYDANFGGSVLVFSWPSAGELLKYDYDRESAEFSGGDLLQVLRILTEEIGDKRVYIVAHSLGNQILVNALQQAFLSKVNLNIAELVLAAPDVDSDVFMKKASEIKSVAKNMTMYVSSADKALLASDKKAWGSRMGYVNSSGPHLVEGIETIDVTSVGDDMFGLDHGTYSANRAVLDDLGRLISSTTHLLPSERTPTLKFMPDKEHVKYWLYPR